MSTFLRFNQALFAFLLVLTAPVQIVLARTRLHAEAIGNVGFVHAWTQLVYELVKAERLSPPVAARLYGYSGITLYESLVADMPGQRSLAGQLNAMPAMPKPLVGQTYDWPIVTAAAMDTVMNGLLLRPLNTTRAALHRLRDEQINARRPQVSKDVLTQSVQHGEDLGNALLNWAASDKFLFTRGLVFTVPAGDPLLWIAPAPNGRPVEPYWGRVRPFVLPTSDACNIPLNVRFSIEPTSAFYAQAMEVKQTGDNLTPEQKRIADFWADAAGLTSTPPGHWVSIALQLAQERQLTRDQSAKLYALLGITLHDAFVSAWDLKFRVNLIRPNTYINQYISPSWTPYLNTPGFPEYPSGHSVGSGAAAVVLTKILGVAPFTDTTHLSLGMPARSFASFKAAAAEAAISRLYGGIHFRVGIENGLQQGQCVGQQILAKLDSERR